MTPPYLHHLQSAADLQTPYAETRAGFIALALEKNRKATPFVAEARALRAAAMQITAASGLLESAQIQPALLTAAGLSDKAAGHLRPEDKQEAIRGFVEQFLEPAGTSFAEELVYRFLLTRGDTLGGSMRNIVGAMAQSKLTRAVLASLALSAASISWLHCPSKKWLPAKPDDAEIERNASGLSWRIGDAERTLLYNLTVPQVKNNVDSCLLNCAPEQFAEAIHKPNSYLALGELKGGIDPAGADEHWKTGRSALVRIRTAFAKAGHTPETFFVAAAVEKKMATEIWDELQHGTLTNAANLTSGNQIAALCLWLTAL